MRQSRMNDDDRMGEIDDLLGQLDTGDGALRMVRDPTLAIRHLPSNASDQLVSITTLDTC